MTNLKQKALSLPLKPGVYIMMDAEGKVIYVGKAKQLKNRVSQYFQDSGHDAKTEKMVSQVQDFDFIIADSEFEALVLECSLIKRHQPKYNILLKDDKGYPFIRVNLNDPYPDFSLVNKIENDGAKYFGPYGGRYTSNGIIEAIRQAFKLPTCTKVFPRDIAKERPCLNYHMERCMAVCKGDIGQEEYREIVSKAVRLMDGKLMSVAEETKREMQIAADNLLFEKAAMLRDRYNAIIKLGRQQKVMHSFRADMDVVGYYGGEAKAAISVLHYIEGELCERDVEMLSNDASFSMEDAISQYVKQYYVGRKMLPKQILLPCKIEDGESIAKLLSQNAGKKVELLTPVRGAKAEMVSMAISNAREEVVRLTTYEERISRSLSELQKAVGMENLPRRIEAFDISNTSGDAVVATMTVFVDGQPKKKDYRKFKIKGFSGQNDYGSMAEVVQRRFNRYLAGDNKFSELPDLLLIDGGAAHAGVAAKVLEELGLTVPVFGMVKDTRHRTRALVSPDGEEIGLAVSPSLFSFVGRIQEETHRTAITFHHKVRSKGVKGSSLDAIEGVGPARRKALLKHFKSIKAIKAATLSELEAVVPQNVARGVYQTFHGNVDMEEEK